MGINLRPSGIKWEEKELLLKSRHDACIYKDRKSAHVKEDSARAKAAILLDDDVCNGYGYLRAHSFDISVTGEYVSIVPIQVVSLKGEEDNVDMETFLDPAYTIKTICTNHLEHENITDKSPVVKTEIRIYKDFKMSVVDQIGDKFYCLTNINATDINCADKIDETLFVEVHSNDEIKSHAQKVTKAHKTLNTVLFNGADLEANYNLLSATQNNIERTKYYYDAHKFPEELSAQLKDFFNSGVNIKSMVNLQDTLIAHPAISTGASTGQYTVHYLDNRNVLVERQGNFIIISQKRGENDVYYVVFDTKRKTCFKTTWSGRLTSFNVGNDAGNYGYSGFSGSSHYYNDDEDSDRYITYNQELKDVYKGTLIEFLLNLPVEKDALYPTNNTKEVKISEILTNGSNIKNIKFLLRMLVCGKYKFYEQLAKSQLINLFIWFVELKASKVRVEETWLSCYNEKGSNLKDALGLNMSQLRILDELVKTTKIPAGADVGYSRNSGDYSQPYINLNRLSKVGFHMDANIDLNSLKKILSFAITWKSSYGYWQQRAAYPDFMAAMSKMKVSEQIAFFEKYELTSLDSDKLEVVNDYYRGRNQLVALHESTSGYPAKPEKGTKFIRYLEGMNFTNDRWSEINSATEFKEQIDRRYNKYDFVKNGKDELIGAIVELTAYENLDSLHIELGHFLALRQDEVKTMEFAQAMTRIQPLEYTDEELGLAIVAPKNIADIRKEASVLSHCVASYIDPICKGSENIMFIRRLDRLDDPYFTLEIVDDGIERKTKITKGEIRQIHCYRNGDPTPADIARAYETSKLPVYDQPKDIIKFLQGWAKKSNGIIKAGSLKEHYRALCAQN